MVKITENKLTKHLYDFLQTPQIASIVTIHNKDLSPVVSCISWIYSFNENTIFFAIDSRSITVENINVHNKICLHVFTNHSVYSINGTATIIQNPIEQLPLNLALIKIEVNEVRDVMFYGSTINQTPQIQLNYAPMMAKSLEEKVYEKFKSVKLENNRIDKVEVDD